MKRSRSRATLVVVALLACALVALGGCPQTAEFWTCDPTNSNPDSPCYAPEDAGGGESDAGPTCSGECVPIGPLAWSLPALVWLGPEMDAPPCPEHAPKVGYEGHTDLVAPGTCDACACDPPVGSCTLPATLTAHSKACNLPGASPTSFDAPASWDGSCTNAHAIQANVPCPGGPCASSLTIGPLQVTQGGCSAKAIPGPGLGTPAWKTFARACVGTPFTGPCDDPGEICMPSAALPPPGFQQCISQKGDPLECPASYPHKHVMYEGFTDTRGCTACGCGAPNGGMCTSAISIYTDGGCGVPLVSSVPISSLTPTCVDLNPPGPALGSKSATTPLYMPATCSTIGGLSTGGVALDGPSTFCCREE